MGKPLFYIGLAVAFLGFCLWMGPKIGLPFGKMPGDFQFRSGKFAFYIPIVSCILVSLFLTLGLNLLFWILKK